MSCDLTILYCTDGEAKAQELKNHYSPLRPTILECIDSLKFPLKPSKVRLLTKSKNVMLLMTPSLLKLFKRLPESTRSLKSSLNVSTTIRILCCGTTEDDLNLCPAARGSWKTVRLSDSQHLYQFASLVLDEIMDGSKSVESISEVVVPHKPEHIVIAQTAEEHSCFYVIFTKLHEENTDIRIIVKSDDNLTLTHRRLNPYVLCFDLPEQYMNGNEMVSIGIYSGQRPIGEKLLEIRESSRGERLNSTNDESPLYEEKPSSEDQPSYDGSIDSDQNSVDENMDDMGLKISEAFFAKLEEEENSAVSPKKPLSMTRSQSLPSLLSPPESPRIFLSPLLMDGNSDYLDMTGSWDSAQQAPARQPHEQFIQNMIGQRQSERYEKFENLLSHHVYSRMDGDNPPGQRQLNADVHELSKSQRELIELMQAFKRGIKTISEVETLFKDWHGRHRESVREQEIELTKRKYGKPWRGQPFVLKAILGLKPTRKISKAKEPDLDKLDIPQDSHEDNNEKELEAPGKIPDLNNSVGPHGNGDTVAVTSNNNGTAEDSEIPEQTDMAITQRKISTSPCVPINSPKTDDQSSTWFLTCPRLAEGATRQPPSRPPPLPQASDRSPWSKKNKVQKPPRKPRAPSPEYILPNDHGIPMPPAQTGSKNETTKTPRPNSNRKISAPNIRLRKKTEDRSEQKKDTKTYRRLYSESKSNRPSLSQTELPKPPPYLELLNFSSMSKPDN